MRAVAKRGAGSCARCRRDASSGAHANAHVAATAKADARGPAAPSSGTAPGKIENGMRWPLLRQHDATTRGCDSRRVRVGKSAGKRQPGVALGLASHDGSPYVRWIRYRDASLDRTMSGRCAQVNGCRVPNDAARAPPRFLMAFDSFSNALQFVCSDKYLRDTVRAAPSARKFRPIVRTVQIKRDIGPGPARNSRQSGARVGPPFHRHAFPCSDC